MIELGILKNFDSGTYKAGVQLAGSLTTYFDDISVAKNIPSSAMVVGNYVTLAIPGGNPKDACVIATWPGGSAGGGAGSFLDLSDTPSSYSGQSGKVAKVKATEDGLEFGAGGGGGGWELVAKVDVTSNTTTVSFTGLDLDAARMYDLYLALHNPLGSTVNYWIYFNNDTTNSHYYIRNLKGYWNGSADKIVSSRFNNPFAYCLLANHNGGCNLVVLRETTDGNPMWLMRGGIRENPVRANGLDILYYAGRWNTATNVTRIDITASAANGIGAGSKLTLFKVA